MRERMRRFEQYGQKRIGMTGNHERLGHRADGMAVWLQKLKENLLSFEFDEIRPV